MLSTICTITGTAPKSDHTTCRRDKVGSRCLRAVRPGDGCCDGTLVFASFDSLADWSWENAARSGQAC